MKGFKILLVVALFAIPVFALATWNDPTATPPNGNTAEPINVSTSNQTKQGQLWSHLFVGSQGGGYFENNLEIGTGINSNPQVGIGPGALTGSGFPANLKLKINGRVGADEYCDRNGANCTLASQLAGVTRVIAGTNVTITPASGVGNVTISATGGSGEANTASNLVALAGGANAGLFKQKSGVDLQFKGIKAGSGISLDTTTDGNSVIINSTGGSGEANTASSAGTTGIGLTLPKSGVDLPFKRLVQGANITLTDNGAAGVTIAAASGSGEANTQSNLVPVSGVAYGIYKQKVGVDLQLKSLKAGSGITIDTTDANALTISATGGSSGEANTASNLAALVGPANSGLYKQKSGVDLQFKGIKAGSGISLDTTTDGNSVIINSSGVTQIIPGANISITPSSGVGAVTITGANPGEVNTQSNLAPVSGIAYGIYKQKVGADLQLKSLKAGSGITIDTNDANSLTISATGGSGEANTASNLVALAGGANAGLFKQKSGVDLQFKGIKAGSGISLDTTTDGNSVIINSSGVTQLVAGQNITISPTSGTGVVTISSTGGSGEANTASNLAPVSGVGYGIYSSKVGVDLRFKSLKAGSGITIDTSDANSLTISSSGSGEANTASSAGTTGIGLTLPKSGVDLPFKRLVQGANITLTDNGAAGVTIAAPTAAMGDHYVREVVAPGSPGPDYDVQIDCDPGDVVVSYGAWLNDLNGDSPVAGKPYFLNYADVANKRNPRSIKFVDATTYGGVTYQALCLDR